MCSTGAEGEEFDADYPGAIDSADVPTALANLKAALDKMPQQVEPAGEAGEDQPAVSLHTRALPLIELLQAAIADEDYVRWE
jgi:hypothetical protein